MALPKSTFVMGAAVIALFGLAIHETATSKAPAPPPDPDDELARYEAEQKAMDAEREARADLARRDEIKARAALRDETHKLFGAEAGSFGGYFAGISLPAKREDLEPPANLVRRALGAKVELSIVGGTDSRIGQITIAPFADGGDMLRHDVCGDLAMALPVAWGTGADVYEAKVWVNAPTHQRAVFQPMNGDCRLTFERYVVPQAVVGRTLSALVSPAMLGHSLREIGRFGGPDVARDIWLTTGIGTGTFSSTIEAKVVRGKIVSVRLSAAIDAATYDAIAASMTETFGTPAQVGDARVWTRPAMRLEQTGGASFALVIGEAP